MVYRFIFIGIDKFSDGSIRDLSGAANDARALWALFADSFPGARCDLITDEQATLSTVTSRIEEALTSAAADDVSIVFFAGHGTRDHRLVVHDTRRLDLTNTTISMQSIADLFRRTSARAAILILDCCFSGGLPARVIEDSPIARDLGDPLTEVAGQGRVIITASRFDEPAYELPGHDHGVLTKALLDTFEAQEHASILALMEDVMRRVRAEAARMGVDQTPVFLGEVQGGLVLPRLIRGANYARLFPDESTITVGNNIQELAAFQLPKPVLDEWSRRFPGGLNGIQLRAVNDFRVLAGQSLLVIAPTSSGKTFIGEMGAAKAIAQGRKAVFLLPYRALVNEKYDQFQATYGNALGLRVIRCTGDYADQVESFIKNKYDLALLTYEMFLSLTVAMPTTLRQLGLVVLDEAQFITDPSRGITVELLLTFLIAARERGVNPQLIALSAVIGDSNRFNDWLGVRVLRSEQRPVPLTESVLDRYGIAHSVAPNGSIQREQLLPTYRIQQRGDKPSSQDVLVPLVAHLTALGQKVLIFRNVRGKTEGCAQYLARDVNLRRVTEAINQLPRLDGSTSSAALRLCLEGGTAFHNSNLTAQEREIVERAFRDPQSNLRVLVATTTVAAGINTPASTVVIAEQEFLGEDGREFTVAEYKNMAGRAGRLGFNEEGKSFILAETPHDAGTLLRKYVAGQLESLHSSFDPNHADTWLLRLLAQVPEIPRDQAPTLLLSTYGGYLASASNPAWRPSMVSQIEHLLGEMLRLGLVEEERGHVRLTPLGRACGNSPLAFQSALRLIDVVRSLHSPHFAPLDLLGIVQLLEEADATYTPMFKPGQKEAVRAMEAAHRYGNGTVAQLQRFAGDQFTYWARCKRAAVLFDWISGVPVEVIEQHYSTTPFKGKISSGDVRRFADNARWCLRSVYEIVAIIYPANCPTPSEIDTLCHSLEVGVPADAVSLLALPLRLTRGEYLSLRRVGLLTPEQVRSSQREALVQIIGEANVDKLMPSSQT